MIMTVVVVYFYYTFDVQILHFRSGVKVSSEDEDNNITMEACSPSERVPTPVFYDPPSPYFYF